MSGKFPLLKDFLLKDAEDDHPVKESGFHRMSVAEWEAIKTEYGIPFGCGIVCIVEFDEEADELTRSFREKISHDIFCLFDSLGTRGCFFLPGITRKRAERLLVSLRKTMPETSFIFGIGQNKPGYLIETSFVEALSELNLKRKRPERRMRDRLRVKEIRRKIGFADPDEMRRCFRLLWNDVFVDSSFTLAKARLFTFFTLLWDDLTGFWGGENHEDIVGGGGIL